MEQFELQFGDYVISADKSRFDLAAIHEYLSKQTYWAMDRSFDTVEKSIRHSLCFGVFASDGKQVGFARIVTDYATFAWLCDVFILEEYRKKDLGKRLIETVVAHPDLIRIQRIMLATRDAHELYR